MDGRNELEQVLSAWLWGAVFALGCGSAGSLPDGSANRQQSSGADGATRTANGQIIRGPAMPSPGASPSAPGPAPAAMVMDPPAAVVMESPGASAAGLNSPADAGPVPQDDDEDEEEEDD